MTRLCRRDVVGRWQLLANFLQRFNTSYWFASDSILAIVIGFIASLPFCSYGEFTGKPVHLQELSDLPMSSVRCENFLVSSW